MHLNTDASTRNSEYISGAKSRDQERAENAASLKLTWDPIQDDLNTKTLTLKYSIKQEDIRHKRQCKDLERQERLFLRAHAQSEKRWKNKLTRYNSLKAEWVRA